MNSFYMGCTGRTARSLKDAFGPYCNNHVEPIPEPKARFWQDAALYVIAPVVMAVIWWQS